MKKFYLFDYRLRWKTFKKLYDSVPDSGPTPAHLSKMLFEMMKKRQILMGFKKGENDISIMLEIPKGYQVHLIKNAEIKKSKP